MAISDLARIQGLTLAPAAATPRTLNAVKQKAAPLEQTQKRLAVKSNSDTANHARTYARKAYTITLSPSDTKYGPTYAKPQ
jgi:hypothetical protein